MSEKQEARRKEVLVSIKEDLESAIVSKFTGTLRVEINLNDGSISRAYTDKRRELKLAS